MSISPRFLKSAACRHATPWALALCALASLPAQAATFSEIGDAGQTPATAQGTGVPAGALTDVFGTIGASNDADLFLIRITDAAAFSATTVNAGSGFLDTQLFLFTLAGAPVFTNDDAPGGTSVQSTLPGGHAFGPPAPGLYLLGISLSGYDPVNSNSQFVFSPLVESTAVRGPADNLQPALLGDFSGNGFGDTGAYNIQLTGAVAAVPEPASWMMFLMAGALGAGLATRRRVRAAAQATSA